MDHVLTRPLLKLVVVNNCFPIQHELTMDYSPCAFMVFAVEYDGLIVDSVSPRFVAPNSQIVICISLIYTHFVVVNVIVVLRPSSSSFRHYLCGTKSVGYSAPQLGLARAASTSSHTVTRSRSYCQHWPRITVLPRPARIYVWDNLRSKHVLIDSMQYRMAFLSKLPISPGATPGEREIWLFPSPQVPKTPPG